MISTLPICPPLTLAPEASLEDIDALGKWFEGCGGCYWDGECYDADGKRLWPLHKKVDEDDYDIIGYTWDHAESTASLET